MDRKNPQEYFSYMLRMSRLLEIS